MGISNGQTDDWRTSAACTKPENKAEYEPLFFSGNMEDRYKAKLLCHTCEVRQECVVWALESKTIWGIWGGKDDTEIRRTLSVNADGDEVRRSRYPQCPYCSARTSQLRVEVVEVPGGGRWTTAKRVVCNQCGTGWKSRSSANAVEAYFVDRQAKKDRIAARRAKQKAKPKRSPARPRIERPE